MGDDFSAIIKFNTSPLSAVQLDAELKDLVDDRWDWKVCRVSETEFTVVFPSQATLRMGSRRGKLSLPLSKVEVDIREASLDPKPSMVFPSTWVQLTGLPPIMIEAERLMAAMIMVGRPLEVDALSLRKFRTEPVRMRFQCRFPEKIKGSVQLTVNGETFAIGVKVEPGVRGAGAGGGDPPRPPSDGDDNQDDDDDEYDDLSPSEDEWTRLGMKDKDKQASKEQQQQGTYKGKEQRGQPGGYHSAPLGDGAFGREKFPRIPFDQYGSNIFIDGVLQPAISALRGSGRQGLDLSPLGGAGELSLDEDSQLTDSACEVAPELQSREVVEMVPVGVGGPGGVEAAAAEGQDLVTQAGKAQAPALGVVDRSPDGEGTKKTATYSRAKGKLRKGPTLVRKSARNKGAGVGGTALEKAQRLAKEKNLEEADVAQDEGTFSAFGVLSDAHMSGVLADSCVVFTPSCGTPSEAISLLRAKEAAQAELAAKAARLEQEERCAAAREAVAVSPSGGPGNPEAVEKCGQADGEGSPFGRRPVIGEAGASTSRSKPKPKRASRSMLSARKGQSKRVGTK
jgi:hypothetical protein